jgi:hypothetical protein
MPFQPAQLAKVSDFRRSSGGLARRIAAPQAINPGYSKLEQITVNQAIGMRRIFAPVGNPVWRMVESERSDCHARQTGS